MKRSTSQEALLGAFLLPAVALAIALSIAPIFQLVRMAVSDVGPTNLLKEWEFVGTANIEAVLADRVFCDEAPATEIPAGRYAVETDEVRCCVIDYGKPGTRWDGFLFLSRISSDDRYPIRNAAEKARILAAISADVDASAILAGLTLRQCRRCGRTLSDTKNPYFEVALGPECGTK